MRRPGAASAFARRAAASRNARSTGSLPSPSHAPMMRRYRASAIAPIHRSKRARSRVPSSRTATGRTYSTGASATGRLNICIAVSGNASVRVAQMKTARNRKTRITTRCRRSARPPSSAASAGRGADGSIPPAPPRSRVHPSAILRRTGDQS